ncbi:Bacterial Ig-like domain 13 [Acidimicrobiia bacterium]
MLHRAETSNHYGDRFRKRVALFSIVAVLLVSASFVVANSADASTCPSGWNLISGRCVRSFTATGSSTWTPPAGVTSIDYLVVGGGGGGATGGSGRRGGAGGQVVEAADVAVSGAAISVTVGSGGGNNASGGASSLTGGVAAVTAAGGAGGGGPSGTGANGVTKSLSGSSVVYGSSGGSGGLYFGGTNAGRGGGDSGGNCAGGSSGVANTGSGGGGGDYCDVSGGFGVFAPTVAGDGGSGIVVIAFVPGPPAVTSFSSTSPSSTNTAGALSYGLNFDQPIDASTLSASDFVNLGSASGCQFSFSPASGSATSIALSVSNCGEGTVTPRLLANSISGSTGTSGPATSSDGSTVTLDRTPPSAPSAPDVLDASDTGVSSGDDLTSDSTPAVSASGGVPGETATITATKGATSVQCSYVVPASSCDLPTLEDGTWSLAATLTDAAGNVSPSSAPTSLAVETAAPSAPSLVDLETASDSGSSNSDEITNDTTPAFSASGGVPGDTMTITATNGSSTWSCSYVIGVESNCVLPALTDGNWNVSATLTDPAGNVSVASSALPLTIDATAGAGLTPDLAPASDSGESSTDNITSDNTPTFSVPGQVAGDVVTITASKSGSADVACTYTVGAATSCDLGSLVDGDWTISGSIVDSAGNAGLTNSLALTIDTAAPAAPAAPDLVEASDSGSSSTDNATSDNTPTLSGGVAANGTLVTITASKNGSPSVSCSYVASPSVSTCDLGTLSDGTWTVGTSMTDPAGNVSQAGASLSIAIDTAAPAAPSTPQSTGPESGRVTVPNVPSGSVVVISGQSGGLSITCTYVAGTQSNCLLQPLAPGLWNLTASITDEAGNASASSGSLALDVVDVVDEVSAGEGEGTGADAGAGGAQLPSTGSSSLALMLWALTFLALGAVLWQMSTRRKLG